MKEKVSAMYGGKLRVRVSGICIQEDSLLLVEHEGIGEKNRLWIPPGGGVEFGEDCKTALKREFKEETGLIVEVNELLYVNDFLKDNLHAIELFFYVTIKSGKLQVGNDPEMNIDEQLIKKVKFVTFTELRIMDKKLLHNSLKDIRDKDSLLNMSGYFKFCQ